MLYELVEVDQIQELRNMFLKVFKGVSPFEEVFLDTICERTLLYPTDGFYLTSDQFKALLKAANAVGDDRIYISEVETGLDSFSSIKSSNNYQCKHWELKNQTNISEYLGLNLIIENAIYSPQGKWGLIISHEDHAILGGVCEFIDAFKADYRKSEADMEIFLRNWEYNKLTYNSNIEWVPRLLKHIRNDGIYCK